MHTYLVVEAKQRVGAVQELGVENNLDTVITEIKNKIDCQEKMTVIAIKGSPSFNFFVGERCINI